MSERLLPEGILCGAVDRFFWLYAKHKTVPPAIFYLLVINRFLKPNRISPYLSRRIYPACACAYLRTHARTRTNAHRCNPTNKEHFPRLTLTRATRFHSSYSDSRVSMTLRKRNETKRNEWVRFCTLMRSERVLQIIYVSRLCKRGNLSVAKPEGLNLSRTSVVHTN